jgi:DnaJ-class molecular chaperone
MDEATYNIGLKQTIETCFDCHGNGCSRCKGSGKIRVWRNKNGDICFTNLSQNEQMGDRE